VGAQGAGGGTGLDPQQQAFNDQLREALMRLIAGGEETPSIDDPALSAQQQAFELAQQRAFERFQIEQAERLGAQGLGSSGAAETGLEGFQQQSGEASAANAASLVGQELERRREELMRGLNLAAQIGDADLSRSLQRELAQIDAELATNALNLERSLGFAGLDLQKLLGLRGLDVQERVGLAGPAAARASARLAQEGTFASIAEQARQFDETQRLRALGLF